MNCASCGKELADTAKFCPGCGMKVENAPGAQAQPQAAPGGQQTPQTPQQQPPAAPPPRQMPPQQQHGAQQGQSPGGAPQQQGILGKRILAYLIDVLLMIVASLIPVAGWIAVAAYTLCRDALFDGRSVGKKAMGIRVVNIETGQPAQVKDSILRNVVLLIPLFPIVEAIILITRGGESRFGDEWFKTRVISD